MIKDMSARSSSQPGTSLPETLIVWVNPVSTNAQRSKRAIRQIQKSSLFSTVTILRTTDAGREANQAALRELLAQQTHPYWLLVAGGDGTIGAAAQVIRDLPQKQLAHIWAFPGGNGNDISTMIHGRSGHRLSPQRLRSATTIGVHPLICEVTYPDKTRQTFVAIAYIGFGSTAHSATAISDSRTRSPEAAAPPARILREAYTVLRVAFEAKSFVIETNDGHAHLFERLIVNGHRIGKNTLWPDNRLAADSYRDVTIPVTNKAGAVRTFLRLLLRKFTGTQRYLRDTISFSLPEGGDMQCDGEAHQLPAGCNVTVTMDTDALTFLRFKKS